MTDADRGAALEAIAAEVRTCTSCRLHETRTRAVPGEGNPDTEVVFVGEGPGFNEDRQGRPFVGRAGALLGKFLATLGWRRDDVFITNIVKCRPPENRDPEPDEIAACAPYLRRQLEILDPALVVTLGRHSLGRFMPGERISSGPWHAPTGRPVDRRRECPGICPVPSGGRTARVGDRAHQLRRFRPDPRRAGRVPSSPGIAGPSLPPSRSRPRSRSPRPLPNPRHHHNRHRNRPPNNRSSCRPSRPAPDDQLTLF